MLGQIIGNLLNVILDPIMILGFGWNIKGAAIANVIHKEQRQAGHNNSYNDT